MYSQFLLIILNKNEFSKCCSRKKKTFKSWNKNRHVALLIDNAGGHNVTEETKKELTHITLKYFEPNCTSWVQPDDQGIIRAFKAYYRRGVVRHCCVKNAGIIDCEEKEEEIDCLIEKEVTKYTYALDKQLKLINREDFFTRRSYYSKEEEIVELKDVNVKEALDSFKNVKAFNESIFLI